MVVWPGRPQGSCQAKPIAGPKLFMSFGYTVLSGFGLFGPTNSTVVIMLGSQFEVGIPATPLAWPTLHSSKPVGPYPLRNVLPGVASHLSKGLVSPSTVRPTPKRPSPRPGVAVVKPEPIYGTP